MKWLIVVVVVLIYAVATVRATQTDLEKDIHIRLNGMINEMIRDFEMYDKYWNDLHTVLETEVKSSWQPPATEKDFQKKLNETEFAGFVQYVTKLNEDNEKFPKNKNDFDAYRTELTSAMEKVMKQGPKSNERTQYLTFTLNNAMRNIDTFEKVKSIQELFSPNSNSTVYQRHSTKPKISALNAAWKHYAEDKSETKLVNFQQAAVEYLLTVDEYLFKLRDQYKGRRYHGFDITDETLYSGKLTEAGEQIIEKEYVALYASAENQIYYEKIYKESRESKVEVNSNVVDTNKMLMKWKNDAVSGKVIRYWSAFVTLFGLSIVLMAA